METDAAAINEAGSLRMQSWRLAEHVVVPEFITVEILAPLVQVYDKSLELDALVVLGSWDNHIGFQYRQIVNEWQQVMRPMLERQDFGNYVQAVPEFVDRIDALVDALQENTENKLRWLYTTMVISLAMLIVISVLVIRDVQRSLLDPVGELVRAANRVRTGNFSIALPYTGTSELGQLTQTFNGMAGELQGLYQNLEHQVESQTLALSRSNSALELLYDSSRTLGNNPFDRPNMTTLLARWQKLLGLKGCYLCLTGVSGHEWLQRVEHASSQASGCEGDRCLSCLDGCGNSGELEPTQVPDTNTFPVALVNDEHSYGFLRVIPVQGSSLNEEERQWLQVFVDILATALSQSRQHEHEHRILLMEERAVIARELHDSLAQSLSYQKIQIARIRRLLPEIESASKAQTVVSELQDGVNSAYRQLRELLVTFRLTMAEGSLKENIESTLQGFIKRADDIHFELDYRIRFQPMGAHQEVHVLQIIREALSNVVQHARASLCRISCYQSDNQQIVVMVDDNGRGMGGNPERHGHYGLSIIRERASSLGGTVQLLPSPQGGTRVQLSFSASSDETDAAKAESLELEQ
ncbi:HAMP domain-containing protein [Parendozoicomonas sp. Alg238-R29]|uniref:HAMP domain-containing protein n=1 Tax=Parendozoicomonas sp. Alg238-R29 TaxID=2993446 RepID=UPI00248DC4EC|nr:HAMP domain-containing protein [Parendozoicomonas sp. Alg238-R29]